MNFAMPDAVATEVELLLFDVLRRAGLHQSRAVGTALAARVGATLEAFGAWEEAPALSAQRRVLQELAQFVLSDDPSIGQIRARVSALPDGAIRHLERRAANQSFGTTADAGSGLDIRHWAQTAERGELIAQLRLWLLDGGILAEGRKRPGGKQSAPSFAPIILGGGRGTGIAQKIKGGRPRKDDLVTLIGFLAVDWLQATGLEPDPGRSDGTPFGDLVHTVFGWLGFPEQATQALRTYWNLKQRGA